MLPVRLDRGGVGRVRGRDRKRRSDEPGGCGGPQPYYSVARNYTVRYYPRFMTPFQQSLSCGNRIAGPNRVGPLYGFVVSINADTIYASFYLDLSQGPEIFTIPATGVTYSLLTLDVFGEQFKTNIPPQTSGTYGVVPAGFTGTLPPGVTEVQVPYPLTTWIIRADKYSSTNQNQVDQATAFRASLRLASLPTYESNPSAGATTIFPQAVFGPRMKAIADDAVRFHTTHFFWVVQAARRSPATVPLSKLDLRLSAAFNGLFAAANAAARHGNRGPLSQMIRGARAAGSEYIQYGNNASAAGYYNAFTDGSGAPLNGSVGRAYRLTFPRKRIPRANRFWSLTAYPPRDTMCRRRSDRRAVIARCARGSRRSEGKP